VQKDVVFSKYLIFPKIIIKECKKKQKYFFGFLGLTRINPRSYISSFTMENQGYVVIYEKPI